MVGNTEQENAVTTEIVRATWIKRDPRDSGLGERQWWENYGRQSIYCAIFREKLFRKRWKKMKGLAVKAAKTLNCYKMEH